MNCYNLVCTKEPTVRVVYFDYKSHPYVLGHSCEVHTYKNKAVALKVEQPIREEPKYLAAKRPVR